jgi:histidine triad (HIT) family protein
MDDCIFCKIVKKEVPTKILKETEDIIAFPDISPSADTHILIIPKKHIDGIQDLTTEHGNLLAQIYGVANSLVKEYNLENLAYRVVVNGGKAQHVPHIHFHLLGGDIRKKI